MSALWQDSRYAIRSLCASPGYAVMVIATMALALSLNTTMFTVFNAYALRPLPVRDPATLFQLSWTTASGGGRFFSPRDSEAVRRVDRAVAEALSYEPLVATLGSQPIFGNLVSENYFSMLDVRTVLGRPLVVGEGAAGASPTIVLSHAAWRARFGGDAAIVGRTVTMLGRTYEIVGVVAKGFNGVGQVPADFWIAHAAETGRAAAPGRTVVIRVSRVLTLPQTEAALLAWAQSITSDRAPEQRVVSVQLQSNAATLPMNAESVALFTVIAAAFTCVLLIAATNVGNMVLARDLRRRREMGIRMALGAGRHRIVRQLVTESLMLIGPAAIAAFALSRVTVRAAEWLLFATMPPAMSRLIRLVDLSPDARVLVYLAIASAMALAIFGVLPVLHGTSTDLTAATRGTLAGAGRPSRLRSALIVGQVTVCVLLLICAGLLLQASRRLGQSDPRFVTRGLWVIQLNQPLRSSTIEELSARSMLRGTAAAWHAPLTGSLRHLAAGPADDSRRISAGYNFVSPEYFPLLGIPVIKGRNFTQSEATSESPVAIVSEATAARLWPNQDPLGRVLAIGATGWQRDRNNRLPAFRSAQVVGVVRDAISGLVFEGPDDTCVYFAIHRTAGRGEALLVRSDAGVEVTRRALETFVEASTQGAVLRVAPLDEMLGLQVYPFRASFAVTLFLGGLAMTLTLTGIYGVVSFLVGQRTREIGIRMALGATAGAVVRSVLLESLRPAALGTAVGLVLALTASKLIATQLSTINAFDLPAYVCGIVIALGSAGLAALVPAARAAGTTNPADILRSE